MMMKSPGGVSMEQKYAQIEMGEIDDVIVNEYGTNGKLELNQDGKLYSRNSDILSIMTISFVRFNCINIRIKE